MRTGDFIPCNCKTCYFCLNGHTSGIAHVNRKRPPVVEYKCETRVKTKKCSVVRVDLGKGNSYCRMCYMNTEKTGSTAEKKKKYSRSRLGCVICREKICKTCWESSYDKHR